MKKLLVLIISILMIIPLVNTSIVLANEDCKHSFNGVEIDLDKIYSEEEANSLGFTHIAGTTSYVFICDICNTNLMVNIPNEEPKEDVTEAPSEDTSENVTEDNLDEYLSKLQEAKELVREIGKWIISAVLGALSGLSVTLVCKMLLNKLVEKVMQGKADISTIKAESEKQIKEMQNAFNSTLASLEKSHNEMMKGFEEMKAQLEEENRKNNEQMQKANAQVIADIDLIKTAIPYMAGGMNELVRNGIAESVYDLLKKGEVNEESEEI